MSPMIIGHAPPPGYQFRILGKWPHGHIEDISPETDQITLQPSLRQDVPETAKMASDNSGTASRDE